MTQLKVYYNVFADNFMEFGLRLTTETIFSLIKITLV